MLTPVVSGWEKMALFQDMSSVFTGVKHELDSKLRSVESGLENVIDGTARIAKTKFETVVGDVYTFAKEVADKVETDVDSVLKAAEKVVGELESESEKLFHEYVKKANGAIADMKSAGATAVGDIEAASKYIRHHAQADFHAVVKGAEKDFDKAKDDFKSAVKAIGDDIYKKVKAAIEDIVTDAKDELKRVEQLKNDVEESIDEKIGVVKHSVVAFKDDAVKELDKVATLVRREITKMEADLKALKQSAQDFQRAVGLTVLLIGIASALGLVIFKNIMAQSTSAVAVSSAVSTSSATTSAQATVPAPQKTAPLSSAPAQVTAVDKTAATAHHQEKAVEHGTTTAHPSSSSTSSTTVAHTGSSGTTTVTSTSKPDVHAPAKTPSRPSTPTKTARSSTPVKGAH